MFLHILFLQQCLEKDDYTLGVLFSQCPKKANEMLVTLIFQCPSNSAEVVFFLIMLKRCTHAFFVPFFNTMHKSVKMC